MAKKFFSGNTLEQAVLQAARHFQLEPEEVAYKQVERRHGFLKVRRRVVIGVDPELPRQAAGTKPQPQAVEPAGEREEADDRTIEFGRPEPAAEELERTPTATGPVVTPARFERRGEEDPWADLDPGDAREAAEEALRRLFRLGGLELEARIETGDEGLSVELSGQDEDQLFEDRGRLLLAVEHLLPRLIRGLTGAPVSCRVDSDNFHEVRAEQLRVLAQEAAAEVRQARRIQTLEPMSPDERRIVHLTLADDPAVETESHGTGLFKRVAIKPTARRSQGFD